jgi:hypothetical protein
MRRAPDGWDPRLGGLLAAKNRASAERRLEEILEGLVDPVVEGVIREETDSPLPSSVDDVGDEADIFEDLSAIARGRIGNRLFRAWEQRSITGGNPEPIANLAAYCVAAARNICVDYLRHERPGRHSLDNSLRVVLENAADLDIWRFVGPERHVEWRCGRPEWHDSGAAPAALDPAGALAARLRVDIDGLARPAALRRIFDTVGRPVRFHDLVGFLADYWDVERPYRLAESQSLPFRLGKAYQDFQPEGVVGVMGTLQTIWREVSRLAPRQAATVLLRMPAWRETNTLALIADYDIASWDEIADVLGLPPEDLAGLAPGLPLDDDAIASLIGSSAEGVARIRQDARRRLQRRRERLQRRGPGDTREA